MFEKTEPLIECPDCPLICDPLYYESYGLCEEPSTLPAYLDYGELK